MWNRWGVFAGGLAGVAGSPGGTGGASGVTAGVWARGSAGTVDLTWVHAAVSDSSYDDIEGRARFASGPLALEGSAGIRGSRLGLPRAYGDVSATLRLSPRFEAVVALGSYPSDPVRGTIPGRYVMAGLRLATRANAGRAVVPSIPAPATPKPAAASPWLSGARVVVEQQGAEPVLVVFVTGGGTHSVEVMGDFTDWKPVALVAESEGRYRYSLPLASGLLRFNVRLDGGPWSVPQGAALGADDFGNGVAVLVVP